MLADLVRALPENYQPIFGHPELSTRVSRRSDDRLAHIVAVYKAMERTLQRPLRVLDLGCAQGFFSHSLANLGASVRGVDNIESNIAVCRALAAERGDGGIVFETANVEDVVPHLEPGQYDLVLGLSVLHHILHARGLPYVQAMLRDLSECAIAGLFELATAQEPQYWAAAQPSSPRDLLKDFAFIHEVARHGTHLSDIERPLYFVSNRFWYLEGEACPFSSWTHVSNGMAPDVHNGTRQFYSSENQLIKIFRLDVPPHNVPNLEEWQREIAFLQRPPAGMSVPRLSICGTNSTEAWLVRERFPGEPLDRLIASGKADYDRHRVLRDVLLQLVTLEEAGLYHNDVRTWNVLIGPDDGATLIDYGAITRSRRDCVWPYDLILSFLIFVSEVTQATQETPIPIRPPWFDPRDLPDPYRRAAWQMFRTPRQEWSFARFLRYLDSAQDSSENGPPGESVGMAVVLEALQELVQKYRDNFDAEARAQREYAAIAREKGRQIAVLVEERQEQVTIAGEKDRQIAALLEERQEQVTIARENDRQIAVLSEERQEQAAQIAKLEKKAEILIDERDNQILIAAAERQKRAAQSAKLQQYSEANETLKAQFRKLTKSRWHKLGRRLGLVKSKVKVKSGTAGIRGTTEIGTLVERIYQLALHRNPSSQETRLWTRQVLDGQINIATLIEAIATSPEAKATRSNGNVLSDMPNGKFIQLVYESLLGRGAMADEIVHWDHILRRGVSNRNHIVSDFFAQGVTEQAPPNDPTLVRPMGTDKPISIAEWHERKNTIGGSAARKAAKTYPSLTLGNRSKILVSAIASLYRGGEFIDQFLRNITSQTIFESCCELVIIDAASPENESAVIASYMKRFPNIVYHRTSTRIGIYEAWNLGIEKARGLYVTNTNLDDLRRQDSFERQAEILEKFPFVDMVYQDFYYSFDGKVGFDEAAAVNARSNVPIITPYNLMRFNSPHNAPMWRRALHEDVGLFDASFKSAGDYDFWIRCVRAGKVFYKVNDPHIVYFVNPKGVSTQPDTRGIEEGKRITRGHARYIISPRLVSSDEEFLSGLSTILELSPSEPERNLPEWRYTAVQHALRRWSVASRPRASTMSGR